MQRQTEALQTELQTRSDALKQTIADTEAARAALGKTDTEQVRLEHHIELAENLTATCETLLRNLTAADAAADTAAARQQDYVKAQAALDEAEAQYAALQSGSSNANRAGLLAQQLQPGQPCPVCGLHRTPLPGPAAPGPCDRTGPGGAGTGPHRPAAGYGRLLPQGGGTPPPGPPSCGPP